jgi:hypothetical protein
MAVGKETVVADAMEAVRQGVEQETPDELERRKGHDLGFVVMTTTAMELRTVPVIMPSVSESTATTEPIRQTYADCHAARHPLA